MLQLVVFELYLWCALHLSAIIALRLWFIYPSDDSKSSHIWRSFVFPFWFSVWPSTYHLQILVELFTSFANLCPALMLVSFFI
jgi:hypothetical protein